MRDFEGIDRYPVALDWRVTARLVADKVPTQVTVPNIIGIETKEASPGVIEFERNGKSPVVMFEDVEGFNNPVVTNTTGNRQLLAAAVGARPTAPT